MVTTFEGPGEPPRITPPPAPAEQHESSARPKPEASAAEHASAEEPSEIAAQHLLVAYRGALRAAPTVTRTREQARRVAEEAERRARAGEDFSALVREYSDEPGAAERGGNLGRFTRTTMVEAFAKAAFALKVGEVSGVVETPFGFHVIKRTE